MTDPLAVSATLVRMRWLPNNGKVASCGLWFLGDTTPTVAELQAMADAMAATATVTYSGNSWETNLPTEWQLGFADAQNWNYSGNVTNLPNGSTLDEIEPTSILVSSAAASIPGTLATGGETPDNALKIRIRTTFPGRRGQGGCYTPAFSEESSDNAGVVSTGVQAFVNAWVLDAASDIEAAGPTPTEWGIFSRTGTQSPAEDANFHGGVVDALVDRRIRNQRRRQVRAALR